MWPPRAGVALKVMTSPYELYPEKAIIALFSFSSYFDTVPYNKMEANRLNFKEHPIRDDYVSSVSYAF